MSNTDVYALDDSAYRDYSREQLARTRRSAAKGKSPVDTVLAALLIMAVVIVILRHQGLL